MNWYRLGIAVMTVGVLLLLGAIGLDVWQAVLRGRIESSGWLVASGVVLCVLGVRVLLAQDQVARERAARGFQVKQSDKIESENRNG